MAQMGRENKRSVFHKTKSNIPKVLDSFYLYKVFQKLDSSSHNLSEQGDMNLERFFHQIFTFISIHVTGIFISDIWSIFIVKCRYKYPVPCNRHGEVYLACMKVMEPWCREVFGWENNG